MATATIDLHAASAQAAVRELFCGRCGYGIVVRREPPDCPMCRSTTWTTRPARARWN
jgi:rubrerythrin